MASRNNKILRNQYTSTLENIQMAVLIPAYIILTGTLSLALVYLATRLSAPPLLILFISIIAVVCFAVLGSFLYVIWSIQFRIQYEFDDIKNSIASGKINDLDKFENELCRFILNFFQYSFFSVHHCIIKLKNRPVHNPGGIETADIDEIEKYAMTCHDVKLYDKNSRQPGSMYTYLLPVWFGHDYHGFIMMLTNKRLPGIFRKLLRDFENNFIDDQLVHVYNKEFPSLP